MSSCVVNANAPPVYSLSVIDTPFEDLVAFYEEGILRNVTSTDVKDAFVLYITEVVEPVGWRAVWKASGDSCDLDIECDFLVEVLNVSRTQLEADVKVLSLLSESCRSVNAVSRVLESNCISVPIIELYPLFEEGPEKDYEKTAHALEYVRFFFRNIWRPWDDPDDDEEIFRTKLSSRLKLCIDIAKNAVPIEVKARASMILREGFEIRATLEDLQSQMPLSDSDSDMSDGDVANAVHLNLRLEELSREMMLLENPLLRNVVVQNNVLSRRSPLEDAQRHGGHVVHVVSERFTLLKMQLLNVDPEACLEFHHTFGSALSRAISGDTVLILPGIYACVGVPWLHKDITIQGIGAPGETNLTPLDTGEIFIDCSSSTLSISNITLSSARHMQCMIRLHRGTLTLRDCCIEGAAADTCIKVLSNAELVMERCEINSSMGSGICVRAGGTLKASASAITKCKKSGISAQHQAYLQLNASIELSQTVVENCGAFGIELEILGTLEDEDMLKKEGSGDISNSTFFGISTKDSPLRENEMGPYGIRYAPY